MTTPAAPSGQVNLPQVVVRPVEPRRPAPQPRRQVDAQQPSPSAPAPKVAAPAKPAATPVAAAPAPAAPAVEAPPLQAPGALTPQPQPTPGAPNVYAAPASQPVVSIDRSRIEQKPVFEIGDVLAEAPGVTVKQGNGPRDQGISIRGSNARNGFGIKNTQVQEDGFPVTQPDGLSRTDLTDPHAYGGIDVYKGPSSVLFGNYATGGAVNFRTRTGSEINGFEQGLDIGSFGYYNRYTAMGGKAGGVEASMFMSDVQGHGFMQHTDYNSQTMNFLATLTPSSADRITVKFIDNITEGNLAVRLSLGQYNTNPFQRGCILGASLPAGCGSVSLFNNGYNVAKTTYSADQAALGREDRRMIAGVRWEHDFDRNTTLRTQFTYDQRDINQPTGTTSAIGNFPSINMSSDLTNKARFLGMQGTTLVGVYYNNMDTVSDTVNVVAAGNPAPGLLTARAYSSTENFGARAREELQVTPQWTGVIGGAIERSILGGHNIALTYPIAGNPAASEAFTWANKEFNNTAKEAGLVWRPDETLAVRGRVATAYGIPQVSNFFGLSSGLAGDNTQLRPQTNLGYDLGADWSPTRSVKLSVTGFYEFFTDELVTQNTPIANKTYTFNAPASEHRGVEAAIDWRFLPGWRFTAAYTYLDEYYTEYTEQLGSGATFSSFNRAGNKIPGISPNEMLARIGYDETSGPLRGWGVFAENQWKDAFWMDNANLLRAPAYDLVNLNVHYTGDIPELKIKGVTWYAEVKNVFDRTYVASANNISDSVAKAGVQNNAAYLAVNGTGSIYAGSPRAFFTGVKVKF